MLMFQRFSNIKWKCESDKINSAMFEDFFSESSFTLRAVESTEVNLIILKTV